MLKLFGFGKNEKSAPCACGEKSVQNKDTQADAHYTWAKVLGAGCSKCNELAEETQKALESLGMDTNIAHITDFSQMAKYGVMSTPALVLGDKVVAIGKILKKEEIVSLITSQLENK